MPAEVYFIIYFVSPKIICHYILAVIQKNIITKNDFCCEVQQIQNVVDTRKICSREICGRLLQK